MSPVRAWPHAFAVAAIGDAGSMRTWSGIPYSFWQAALRHGWDIVPARLDLASFRWSRRWWNLRQFAAHGTWGGYQYSADFLATAERAVEPTLRARTVISFSHQFPRAATVRKWGGRIFYYLDAVLAAELDGLGLPLRLAHGADRALAIERDNLSQAEGIFTMANWLREYLIAKCGIAASRVRTLAPGANLTLPEDWRPIDRDADLPFVLGLVGADWRRKGLEFLLSVAERLTVMGIGARVRVIGASAAQLPRSGLIEAAGFVSKTSDTARFCALAGSCDVGCLFSSHEAYGISILEFLHLGVPVAGFLHEGMADSIPADAGFGFPTGTSADDVAARLAAFARRPEDRRAMRARARAWAPRVTWDRCVAEMGPLLAS